MSAHLALERSLTPALTVRNVLRLIAYSGRRGRWLICASIALAAFAAAVDGASFILLRKTLGDGASAGAESLYSAMAFLTAALIGSILRLVAQGRTVRAQLAVGNALALRAFSNLQGQSYSEFMRAGASAGFAAFERLQTVTYFGINQLIAGAAALLSAVILMLGVALVYPVAAALMALSLIGILLEAGLRRGCAVTSPGLSDLSRDRALLLFEASAGFRHIFLANGQARMCADFARVETGYRAEQARATLAGQSSRHTVEIAGIVGALLVLGVTAFNPISGTTLVPLLAVTALAIFRLLPQLAALRSAARLIALHARVTDDVVDLLKRLPAEGVVPATPPITLRQSIEVRDVGLTHPDRPVTLHALNLRITFGERLGILGDSGAGKSSLLDILCGAIAPDRGSVEIDGQPLDALNGSAWRERIGIVSQSPILLGATLRQAVTFPVLSDAADTGRFAAAVSAAGILPMIADFPQGLDTPVGEASSLLSGGQRQRLALAHALYRARDLLVLDEATGQLDPESEAAIVRTVTALPRDLTIIVVSHRTPIFACCDRILRLESGRLVTAD